MITKIISDMNNRLLYLFVIIFLFAGAFFVVKKNKRNYIPKINLVDISLKDLDGNVFSLANFSGKPLVINFWGTWCGPCRQELPIFEEMKKKYGSQVNFIMVSDENVEKLVKFKTANNYTFFYAQSQLPFYKLGIKSVPVTYFYDAMGNLFEKTKNSITAEELNKFIVEIIKEQ